MPPDQAHGRHFGVFPEINGAFARIDGWHVIRETIPPPLGERTNVARLGIEQVRRLGEA